MPSVRVHDHWGEESAITLESSIDRIFQGYGRHKRVADGKIATALTSHLPSCSEDFAQVVKGLKLRHKDQIKRPGPLRDSAVGDPWAPPLQLPLEFAEYFWTEADSSFGH